MIVSEELKDKFFNRITKRKGCWEWQTKDMRFWYKWKHYISARRASMLIAGYRLKDCDLVLCKCKNHKCVNPEHLYIGTAKQRYNNLINNGFVHAKGYTMPKIHVEKMKKLHSGKTTTEKTKIKIGEALMGNKQSKATRLKKSHSLRGEKNPSSKLSEEQVLEILSLKGSISGYELAPVYGVSKEQIYKIWKGLAWKHIS